jgi:hypothetical protein
LAIPYLNNEKGERLLATSDRGMRKRMPFLNQERGVRRGVSILHILNYMRGGGDEKEVPNLNLLKGVRRGCLS